MHIQQLLCAEWILEFELVDRLLKNYWEALLNRIPQHMQEHHLLQSRALLHLKHFLSPSIMRIWIKILQPITSKPAHAVGSDLDLPSCIQCAEVRRTCVSRFLDKQGHLKHLLDSELRTCVSLFLDKQVISNIFWTRSYGFGLRAFDPQPRNVL